MTCVRRTIPTKHDIIMEEVVPLWHPLTYSDPINIVPLLKAIEDLWENAQSMVHAYNLIVHPLKATKLKA